MSEKSDPVEAVPGYREIVSHIPALMALEHEIRKCTGLRPTGVTLPRRLKPEAEPETGAMMMGMPVTWGDQVGLVYSYESRFH